MSSLSRGHANILSIIPILVYVLLYSIYTVICIFNFKKVLIKYVECTRVNPKELNYACL